MRIILLLMSFVICLTIDLRAQDIHFSHIHASPLHLNPSMTGLIHDGAGRIILNSKSQWNSVTNGYKTNSASADVKLFGRKGTLLSGGMHVFSDKAGDLDFTTIKTAISGSVIKSLDYNDNYIIGFGFNLGQVTNRIDYTKMIGFEDEPLIAQGIDNKITYYDMGVGLSWFAKISPENSFYLGASYWHFNTPDVTLSRNIRESNDDESLLEREKLYTKKVLHGGGSFKIGRKFWVQPSIIFVDQGPHQEINTGSFLKYNTKTRNSKYSFYAGLWIRGYLENDINGIDAAVASIRTDINRTHITLSYDINLSTYKRASNGAGGFELSLIQILEMKKYSRRLAPVSCPSI